MSRMRWFWRVGFAYRPTWTNRKGCYRWNRVHVLHVGPFMFAASVYR